MAQSIIYRMTNRIRSPSAGCHCWFLSLSLLAGCIAPIQGPPSNQTPFVPAAVLEGFVTMIDGQYSNGATGPRSLTLGCHIVTTSADPPRATGPHTGTPRPIPTVHFILNVKANHRYVIQRDLELVEGRWRRIVVHLEEYGPEGTLLERRIGHASNSALVSCADMATGERSPEVGSGKA